MCSAGHLDSSYGGASSQLDHSSSSTSVAELVILGSGVSTAIPRISCIIRPGEEYFCRVCHDAVENPDGPNRRCNVSAIVRLGGRAVLIDCGKTIREAAIRHFPKLGLKKVDSIFLTHGHADAVLGLDDSRDIQQGKSSTVVRGSSDWMKPDPTPVFLNKETMDVCKRVFPYLVPEDARSEGSEKNRDIKRRVAALEWNVYPEESYFKPIRPHEDVDIEITPFPMLHGGEYVCMGFLIKMKKDANAEQVVIAYMSDLHAMPEQSEAFLDSVPRINVLVVDMLTRSDRNKSHFNLAHTKAMVRQIRAERAFAVGMTCSLGLHDDVNKELAKMDEEGLNFRLAYDGMRILF